MVRLSGLVSVLAAASAVNAKPADNNPKRTVPGAYIFEFEDGHDSAEIKNAVSSEGTIRHEYNSDIFSGVSVVIDDTKNAEEKAAKMATMSSIKAKYPVTLYDIPKPDIKWTGNPKTAASTEVEKRAKKSADTYSTHVMTQVDKLRKKGYTGLGVKIAVIDTGVDYNHPALGGCFGEGCLISFGTDLVGDDYTGYNDPVPDNDPMDCAGHGTHVSGIVAAQKNKYDFTGAVPDATLGMYRVLGCDGSVGNDVLIQSYIEAYHAGADIITASIGGPSGWSEDPWAVTVSRIVAKGVPCTIAAGNEGDVGQFYASGAADGKGVTSIASFDNWETPTILYESTYTIDGGKDTDFGYLPGVPADWAGVKLRLWAPSYDLDDPAGGCDPYPSDTPDLSGYIVLVRRGTCLFTDKAQNAADAGAKYLMVYNNVDGALEIDVSTVDGIVAAGMTTPDYGETWINALADGSKVVLDMVDPDTAETQLITSTNDLTGGALSTYTTWGPTWEMDLKPQVGTPGGNILSTWPLDLGGYAVLSGTSMATPLAAGIFALLSQVRGTFDPATLENLLSSTAKPYLFNDGTATYDWLAPVTQQGGGMIQAYDAAYSKTLLEPSGLSFNDTDNFPESLNFTIKNTGKKDVTYNIGHVHTDTIYTLDAGSIYPSVFPNEAIKKHAKLKFSEKSVSIPGGESVTIEVMPTPPQGVKAKRLPVWSGWVTINGTDGSSLSLPYQGLTGSLHKATVLGSEDVWITKSTDTTNYTPVKAKHLFTLPAPGTSSDSNATLPTLAVYLALGSAQVRADIVPLGSDPPATTDSFGVPSIGQPAYFPLEWVPRSLYPTDWDGELASGNFAPPGEYKMVVRALKLYGNPKKDKDWKDVAETQAFRIKYE